MSSRTLVFIVPLVVIAVFWLMARWEARSIKDASRKSYFERNGKALGIAFILLVAFWMLFLVVLPYLYMVRGELPSGLLPPMKRGGPEDVLTLAAIRDPSSCRPPAAAIELDAYQRLRLLDRRLDHRRRRSTSRSAIRWPITWPRRGTRRRCG